MPASDFATHDPDFSAAQEAECARIIDGLRRVNAKAIRLGGSLEALSAAADRVEALLDSLDEVTATRAIESYRFKFDVDDPNAVIPFNPATGEYNPLAPDLRLSVEGKTLVGECRYSDCYESAPDTVQGGMVAAVYDQLLAYAVMLDGWTGPTLSIEVRYLKPTPINAQVRFECRVDSVDGRKFRVSGRCLHGDRVVSEASALVLGSYEIPQVGAKSD
jgi:hypothetical protein